jgi:hypothetical protein
MITEKTSAAEVKKEFQQAGFEVLDAPDGTIEVRKYGCAHSLKRDARLGWVPAGPPRFLIRGQKYELEDRGYQKFWFADGRRIPIRLADLRALRQFDQETRALLHLKSLYHESLGTTNARTVYDRLEGRPDQIAA